MIKLDYMNPDAIPANQASLFPNPNTPGVEYQHASYYDTVLASFLPHFTADVHLTSPSLYTFAAHDVAHYLSCNICLDIQEGMDDSEFGTVNCDFPIIDEQFLEAMVWGEEFLVDMVAAQFYLKVLERLLTFCANHNATRLVMRVPSISPARQFYKPVAAHTETITRRKRKDAIITLYPNRATYEKLILHMEGVEQEFQEMLEERMWDNPIVLQYLKLRSFSCPA